MHLLHQAWLLKPLQAAMRRVCSQEPLAPEGGALGRKQSHQRTISENKACTLFVILCCCSKNWLITHGDSWSGINSPLKSRSLGSLAKRTHPGVKIKQEPN